MTQRRFTRPVAIESGKIEFVRTNSSHKGWRDLYRSILGLTWPRFALVVFGLYITINLLFASAYVLNEGCIAEMPAGSFRSAFFFSVQTLSTVGFGHLYPATFYGDAVTTLEVVVGMFFTAVVTGLIFVRFSRPVARLVFSDSMVISNFGGVPTLQFRVANLHNQAMVEAEFRLMMIRREAVEEENDIRRFYTLKLHFDRMIMFPAALLIRHTIDETSPLFGATPESLAACGARFMTSIVCVDTVIQASVQSQTGYMWSDVKFGQRFVEIYSEMADGNLSVDYGLIHATEPLPSKPATAAIC